MAQDAAIIFTYLKGDEPFVDAEIQEITSATGDFQKYLLSKLILRDCENFVLSPRYFEAQPKDKMECIKKYFLDTTFNPRLDVEDPRLYLF